MRQHIEIHDLVCEIDDEQFSMDILAEAFWRTEHIDTDKGTDKFRVFIGLRVYHAEVKVFDPLREDYVPIDIDKKRILEIFPTLRAIIEDTARKELGHL